MTWGVFQKPGAMEIHVIPLEDLRDHECKPECWCRPAQEADDAFLLHAALDGREAFERGERLPS